MAACVVHAGGSDGGIQAHIKACATLGAICSSVVTAHNTIVVQVCC
ncbi:Os03g0591700 [Oryza sativa Japonica Group]|uniref:Os03g0591700 protein n=1 Tax=Oryza sativa subsp. japonica TaxID=39947 RepID=C7J079_ORYSJ|nr:Os03g0591700 [Oryza sativa Japonica Group]|eukprot:NP_001173519.1 Os03g0591700 [Oryza sativa Japonica Group]